MSISAINGVADALQSAHMGISAGLTKLAQDAQVTAESLTSSRSSAGDAVTNALLDSLQQRLAIEASARVLTTADQTLGSLIDVFA